MSGERVNKRGVSLGARTCPCYAERGQGRSTTSGQLGFSTRSGGSGYGARLESGLGERKGLWFVDRTNNSNTNNTNHAIITEEATSGSHNLYVRICIHAGSTWLKTSVRLRATCGYEWQWNGGQLEGKFHFHEFVHIISCSGAWTKPSEIIQSPLVVCSAKNL
jgi:hypothetical protein